MTTNEINNTEIFDADDLNNMDEEETEEISFEEFMEALRFIHRKA